MQVVTVIGGALTILIGLVTTGFADEVGVRDLTFIDNDGVKSVLTIADLDAMPQTTIRIKTPWREKEHDFSGVAINDFVASTGLDNPQKIALRARDNYEASLSREDWEEYIVIIATRIDGKPLSIKDSGPMRILFDRKPSVFNPLWPNINRERRHILVWYLKELQVIN